MRGARDKERVVAFTPWGGGGGGGSAARDVLVV